MALLLQSGDQFEEALPGFGVYRLHPMHSNAPMSGAEARSAEASAPLAG